MRHPEALPGDDIPHSPRAARRAAGRRAPGYAPFEFDVSSLVEDASSIRVTVRVDNRLTMQTVPPGIVDVSDDGRLRQRYFHDFYNYAGLARSVLLLSTPVRHIRDIAVRTGMERDAASCSSRSPAPARPASCCATRPARWWPSAPEPRARWSSRAPTLVAGQPVPGRSPG